MISKVKVSTIFNCSLERAFKTPILCDVIKVHTGFVFSPRVTHTLEDENWGKPGFSKKVFIASSILMKAGWAFNDKVLERVENDYWKIELSNFQVFMFGLSKFVGVWKTKELKPNEILIDYTYELYSKSLLLFPFHWLFTKVFWRIYMKRVIENIRIMVKNNEPYLYQ